MRYQGRITTWKDDKGFGFITANGGNNQVFVHIKSFLNRQRRPVGNEVVTYELKTDVQGRARAENVEFAGEQTELAGPDWRYLVSLSLTALFLAFVAGSAFAGKLPFAVFGLYLGASTVAFVAYERDKSAAKNRSWRTRESTLHFVALLGGWPGALIAQSLLRHKSKKAPFQFVFWVTVLLNCGALGWLFLSSGDGILRNIFSLP